MLSDWLYTPRRQLTGALALVVIVAALAFGGWFLFHNSARGEGSGAATSQVIAAPTQGIVSVHKVIEQIETLDHGFAASITPEILTKALASTPGARLVKDDVVRGYGELLVSLPVSGKTLDYCIEIRGATYPSAFVCAGH